MSQTDFETRYRVDPDPWRYRTSGYEHAKYAATLEACGPGPFVRALELGASIGVFSALLAPRCQRLITVDGAATAVAIARTALGEQAPNVDVRLAAIPDGIPDGPFDLIVASEILYYLEAAQLTGTLARLEAGLAPGGRLVAAHWRPAGAERPFTAADVHGALAALPWLAGEGERGTDEYLLEAFTRR